MLPIEKSLFSGCAPTLRITPYEPSEEDEEDDEREEDEESEEEESDSDSVRSASHGSTTGVSSMGTPLHPVESGGTLSEFFSLEESRFDEDGSEKEEDEESDEEGGSSSSEEEEDEGNESDSSPQTTTTTIPLAGSTPPSSNFAPYEPMKPHLRSICTIGTGCFGRVELAKHNVTGRYYALKALYVPTIIEKRQVEHVHNEKQILERLNHRFIVKLYDTAKDQSCLFMVMEFLAGGELFSYLRMTRTLPSAAVKFYAAEIICALEYLHSMLIAYRDLKPENLMLTQDGHIKLIDFSFAKEIHTKSYTLCGTTCYLAPELANRSGHDRAVDLWALGVLIFELIAGFTPFPGDTVDEVQSRIVEYGSRPEFPRKTFSVNAKDVIIALLQVEPPKRLGYSTMKDLKEHVWFSSLPSFDEVLAGSVKAPIIPTVFHEGDCGNFDAYNELEKRPPAKQRELDLFDDW